MAVTGNAVFDEIASHRAVADVMINVAIVDTFDNGPADLFCELKIFCLDCVSTVMA